MPSSRAVVLSIALLAAPGRLVASPVCSAPSTSFESLLEGHPGAPTRLERSAVDTGYVTVPGGRLYYEAQGSGDPLVLVHGNAGDRRHWDLQVSALSRRFRVIRYDVRGFGKSSVPMLDTPYANHEDLLALLDQLRIDRAHLMGWSMGSAIAIDFALAHPERMRSLILVGPWVNGIASPRAQQVFAEFAPIREAKARAGRAGALDAWMNAPFFRATARDSAASARFRAIAAGYSFWHFDHRDPARSLAPAAATRTADIAVSTLVITAEHEIPACLDAAELLEGTIARVRTVVMPAAGHLVQMEAADRFNEIVLGFLSSVQREPLRDGFVSSEPDVDLHYRIVGGGADTVVIPAATWWLPHVTPLTRAYTLILYDPRSRGLSSHVATDRIGMTHEIDDLEAVRRHFGLSRMSLVGWSYLGAMVALYAIRHPEHVQRLVMVDPLSPRRNPYWDQYRADVAARGDTAANWRLAELQRAGRDTTDPVAFCTDAYRVALAPTLADYSATDRILAGAMCELPNEWPRNLPLDAMIASWGAWDWREEARTVRVPVLVVHGQRDNLPLEGSREWAANFGDARLLVIPGAGHYPHVEAPTRFFGDVGWFLSGKWPDDARQVDRSP